MLYTNKGDYVTITRNIDSIFLNINYCKYYKTILSVWEKKLIPFCTTLQERCFYVYTNFASDRTFQRFAIENDKSCRELIFVLILR